MNKLKRTFRERILIIILITTTIASFAQTNQKYIKTISGKSIKVSQLDRQIKMIMDSIGMPGLSIAIINNVEIVYHNNFGVSNIESKEPVTNESIFEAASLSKPLFAYFILKQVEKGLLDLDSPLYKYLPFPDIEYDDRYKMITARMVLSHTSGLPNWRALDNDEGKLTIKFTPGTEFNYSGEGYEYLASVAAKINGTDINRLDKVFQKEIAGPIGAKYLYYNWNDDIKKHKVYGHNGDGPTDNGLGPSALGTWDGKLFGASGSLHTNAVSYAKFLCTMLKREGLRKSSFEEMLKEQVHFKDDNKLKLEVGQTGWGLGFAQKPTTNGMIHLHTGNNHDFQAYAMFCPEKQYGFVFFTNSDKAQSFVMEIGKVIEKQF